MSLLSVENLQVHYRTGAGPVRAVDGATFSVAAGSILGLVGESGCGKSTVARTVMRLVEPTAGTIRLGGTDVTQLSKAEMRPFRRQMQMVFQDPFSSLNPRMTAGAIVREPLLVHGVASGAEADARTAEIFAQVGLRAAQMNNFPHQFSGGQRQRVSIARALALNPRLIVADEPVSALDVSIQAQVINLLMDLQREHRLSYLFIAHDLAVVEHISHRVAVMYLGRIVEQGDPEAIFADPLHPYSRALVSAIPVPGPRRIERIVLSGDPPNPADRPSGCAFHPRCPLAVSACRAEVPELKAAADGRQVACHLVEAA